MKKILFLSVIFCLALILPFGVLAKEGIQKQKGASCTPCHADFSSVLPKTHKPVKGIDISACTACHKPDFSGKAEPKPFSAQIHRAHTKKGVKADCLLCHQWTPGKQLGLKGTPAKLGPIAKKQMPLIKEAFTSWSNSKYLDSLHAKANVGCLACHGKTLPETGDTVDNDRCLECHGSLDSLVARSAPKDFPDRNPHKSHLGSIACTVCHHAHAASTVYCLGCHPKFAIKPIPGA